MVDPPRNGGERRQIPRGCVVPDREERLEIRRRSCRIGLYYAITSQAPSELIVESQILTAQFQVVPAERGRKVVPNRLGVLKNIQRARPDRIAAQHDNHGPSVQDWVIGKIATLPSDRGLVLSLVMRQASSNLIYGPVLMTRVRVAKYCGATRFRVPPADGCVVAEPVPPRA